MNEIVYSRFVIGILKLVIICFLQKNKKIAVGFQFNSMRCVCRLKLCWGVLGLVYCADLLMALADQVMSQQFNQRQWAPAFSISYAPS